MSLAKMIEEAPIENGVRVVWDSRGTPSGTRLEIHPASLDGFRAVMQDNAGTCTRVWMPDSTELDVATAALDAFLEIQNR